MAAAVVNPSSLGHLTVRAGPVAPRPPTVIPTNAATALMEGASMTHPHRVAMEETAPVIVTVCHVTARARQEVGGA